MPINTLATATLFQTELDKAIVADACTGWMEANAGQVIYNGGSTVKIPKLTMDGLGDYSRDAGYAQGSVTLTYGTYTLTQDRGRKFQLDAMDIDENNFVTTAATVMGEFQRTKVVPEVDAYRISKIASKIIAASVSGMTGSTYTPGTTANTTALGEFKAGIKAIRAQGYMGPLVAHVSALFLMELELEMAGRLAVTNWMQGGVQTQIPSIDGCALILTPDSAMVSAITTLDGTTAANAATNTASQLAGGFSTGNSATVLNFVIMPVDAPVAVSKQDKIKIFTPEQNQDADAWKLNYRKFHDIWVLDNKLDVLYLSKQS